MKKIIALFLVLGLLMAGCGGEPVPAPSGPTKTPTAPTTDVPADTLPPTEPKATAGKVRILDTDLSRQSAWEALAVEYAALTGVQVSLMVSDAAPLVEGEDYTPTIFTASYYDSEAIADLCVNLSGQNICTQLLPGNFTLRSGDKVLGIAAQTRFFGLVYNTSLLARAAYTRGDLQSVESLASVAGSITANRDALGFAAFACPDLSNTEFDGFAGLFGSVPGDLRRFWDIYTENAACSRGEIAERTTTGGLEELLKGEAVFYLAGTEDYDKLRTLEDRELAMLPVFFEGGNQESQGLCAVDTIYWCIHAAADEADQQAALAFLEWLVMPRADGTVPVDDFGVLAPYRQAVFAANPLEAAARAELLAGKQAVVCERFLGNVEALAQALADYAGDPTEENWSAVTQAMIQ